MKPERHKQGAKGRRDWEKVGGHRRGTGLRREKDFRSSGVCSRALMSLNGAISLMLQSHKVVSTPTPPSSGNANKIINVRCSLVALMVSWL